MHSELSRWSRGVGCAWKGIKRRVNRRGKCFPQGKEDLLEEVGDVHWLNCSIPNTQAHRGEIVADEESSVPNIVGYLRGFFNFCCKACYKKI